MDQKSKRSPGSLCILSGEVERQRVELCTVSVQAKPPPRRAPLGADGLEVSSRAAHVSAFVRAAGLEPAISWFQARRDAASLRPVDSTTADSSSRDDWSRFTESGDEPKVARRVGLALLSDPIGGQADLIAAYQIGVTGRFRSGTDAFTAHHAEPLHHGHHGFPRQDSNLRCRSQRPECCRLHHKGSSVDHKDSCFGLGIRTPIDGVRDRSPTSWTNPNRKGAAERVASGDCCQLSIDSARACSSRSRYQLCRRRLVAACAAPRCVKSTQARNRTSFYRLSSRPHCHCAIEWIWSGRRRFERAILSFPKPSAQPTELHPDIVPPTRIELHLPALQTVALHHLRLQGRIARDGARASSSSLEFSKSRGSYPRSWISGESNPVRPGKNRVRSRQRLRSIRGAGGNPTRSGRLKRPVPRAFGRQLRCGCGWTRTTEGTNPNAFTARLLCRSDARTQEGSACANTVRLPCDCLLCPETRKAASGSPGRLG
jgi:hypothetical protein